MVRAPAAHKKQLLGPHEDLEWGVVQQERLLKEICFLYSRIHFSSKCMPPFCCYKFHMRTPLYVKIETQWLQAYGWHHWTMP